MVIFDLILFQGLIFIYNDISFHLEPFANDPKILAVIIHQSDKLRMDINMYRPIVRVHIVDLDMDGEYVKKFNK